MRRRQKAPIVLAALLFALAAIAEIATGRSRVAVDTESREQTRRATLVHLDEALARHDVTTAVRAWQEAYELARQARSWRGLVEAADAHIRIGVVANTSAAAAPRAREIYLAALGRARADRSVDGVVRVAEGFAALGDREVTELALRIADSLASRSGDAAARRRVEVARGLLLPGPPGLARTTF
jgi:hypothetical protein